MSLKISKNKTGCIFTDYGWYAQVYDGLASKRCREELTPKEEKFYKAFQYMQVGSDAEKESEKEMIEAYNSMMEPEYE